MSASARLPVRLVMPVTRWRHDPKRGSIGLAMCASYANGPSTTPLLGETIGDNLDGTAARFPDRDALCVRHQELRLTYAELVDEVDLVARGLIAAGIERGDRVGIWAPNCAEWVLVQYASAKIGAILVNINPAYRTTELEYALNQSRCRMLVAARGFKSSDYVAMVDEVRPRCGALERVVWLDAPDWEELRAGADAVPDDERRRRQAELQ